MTRVFDYYLATAAAGMTTLHPAEAHRRPDIAPASTPAPTLADAEAACDWLDTERPALVAVAAYTAAHEVGRTGRRRHPGWLVAALHSWPADTRVLDHAGRVKVLIAARACGVPDRASSRTHRHAVSGPERPFTAEQT